MPAAAHGQTVFALSTPPGRSAIAVVRITGPQAGEALRALAGALPRPRHATRAVLKDPGSGAVLDDALVLWFPAPHSFTGEDVVELHLHGGRAVVVGVLEILAALPEFSPAEPGDFTRRAFECGKLDLSQAEGLADLIDAETSAQRAQALRLQGGALAALVEGWRAALIELMALAEARIDFPDEDLPAALEADIAAAGGRLHRDITAHLARAGRGERIRNGFRIALLGAPNAGKSSLLNALAARDVAIVTEEAGTTRDVLEIHLDLGGYAVTLADMAGIREAAGRVEAIGIARARAWAEAADLRVFLVPPDAGLEDDLKALHRPGDLMCRSKADLFGPADPADGLRVSAVTGEGVDVLITAMTQAAAAALGSGEPALVTRLRHRVALEVAAQALAEGLAPGKLPELQAEDFRMAARALGRVTGRVDVEDVLDRLFGAFCIGK